MSRNALIAAAAFAAVAAISLAPAPVAAKSGGPTVNNNSVTPIGSVNVQATQPRIAPKVKIKFNCYYSRQRNELGVWVTVRICG